jgi:hypothetical protein
LATTPAPIIVRVRRDLDRVAAHEDVPDTEDFAKLAEMKVGELWESRVKVFIPVVALRAACDELDLTIATGTNVVPG